MVECVLTWIREQYCVVCNIAKWTILCIVVHFQPVITLLQKGVRVHHRHVILMQKNAKFFWGGGTAPSSSGDGGHPLPTPHPTRRLDLNPSHSEILPTLLHIVDECQLQNVDGGSGIARISDQGNASIDQSLFPCFYSPLPLPHSKSSYRVWWRVRASLAADWAFLHFRQERTTRTKSH